MLDIGKPTGVFASELTVPYYAFLDAGMEVDVASPLGGVIPVDPMSLKPVIRCEADDRFLADDVLRAKVTDFAGRSRDLDMADYDLVFLAGGWGAAFDFGVSEPLADADHRGRRRRPRHRRHLPRPARPASTPRTAGRHAAGRGPPGHRRHRQAGARAAASPSTPHPPRDRAAPGRAPSSSPTTRFRDPFANHWVVDGNLVTGQNQNAGPMVAREMLRLVAEG